jgi:DNA polymerase-3 subunit delta'
VCVRIADGNHPDIVTLEREGAAQIIPIGTVRERVLSVLGLPPHEARARVFLVEEATAMQGPAANALLKTLEEPPARTHFVLCTAAPQRLLPTIRSRCQRVSFAGRPAGSDEDGAEDLQVLLQRTEALLDQDGLLPSELTALATDAGSRDIAPAYLDGLAHLLHQRARAAASENLAQRARLLSRRASLVLSNQVAITQHNAHPQLAVEDLLVRLRKTL